jgi:hypothetical protein
MMDNVKKLSNLQRNVVSPGAFITDLILTGRKIYKWDIQHNKLIKPQRTSYYSINIHLLAQMLMLHVRPYFGSSSGILETIVKSF